MQDSGERNGKLLLPAGERAREFLKERGLRLVERLGKGWSSEIFLVEGRKWERLVLKVEREKAQRFKMVEREAANLEKANSLGIGPKLAGFDLGKRAILMEFIEGPTLAKWLLEGSPKKEEVERVVQGLLEQGRKLDKAGLDHGQLAGAGKNILVRKGKPVIIDWEKGSRERKCHNRAVLEAFLLRNPKGVVAKRVRELLGKEAFTS